MAGRARPPLLSPASRVAPETSQGVAFGFTLAVVFSTPSSPFPLPVVLFLISLSSSNRGSVCDSFSFSFSFSFPPFLYPLVSASSRGVSLPGRANLAAAPDLSHKMTSLPGGPGFTSETPRGSEIWSRVAPKSRFIMGETLRIRVGIEGADPVEP